MTDDLIRRQAAIDALQKEINKGIPPFDDTMGAIRCGVRLARNIIEDLPSAQPKTDEWCTDCKEYNHETHSCPRWNRVIRTTVEEVKANNQPKQGEWIIYPNKEIGCTNCRCSECRMEFFFPRIKVDPYAFCPNCGSRNRKEKE